ncbi:hypothetical protein POL68_36725 [Stigmatella sp. ncwal1]|uniref:Transposase n=1 Tax=Stigmatella ashevillensis TaxID=2995309 RepID=A0ABT5DKC6_9BACT|nr:hypothetical protein [Stigmatella ashevillena]MDC0714068.1 hypothetical protein [Stigmatella ashevillena]
MTGGSPLQAFYSTDLSLPAEQVLAEYAGCWSIEEAFQDSKSHLGFEEPQGWSRLAVLRTAPLVMLLYSLTVLWFAQRGHRLYKSIGVDVSREQMAALHLERSNFHGEWNYTLRPN